MKPRVVHICTRHQALDSRIFWKECRALVSAGYDVHLLAPDPPCARFHGVRLHAVPKSRLQGVFGSLWLLLRSLMTTLGKARALRARVYHLHEVELIPLGILLKFTGAKVVYDVHEDAPAQAMHFCRGLHHPLIGRVLATVRWIEETASKCVFDAFVCATPTIAEKFPAVRRTVVCNYPLWEEFSAERQRPVCSPPDDQPARVIYLGGITPVRGIREMIEAMEWLRPRCRARLVLGGEFANDSLRQGIRRLPGWRHVEYLGWLDRSAVVRELRRADVGLVVLHPGPTYAESLPIKLFEYMAAGLPVVASDFPRWRQIIEGAGCGLLVDPLEPEEIARAVERLLAHPDEARRMGQRGRQAVRRQYHFGPEAERLLRAYHRLTGSRGSRAAVAQKP